MKEKKKLYDTKIFISRDKEDWYLTCKGVYELEKYIPEEIIENDFDTVYHNKLCELVRRIDLNKKKLAIDINGKKYYDGNFYLKKVMRPINSLEDIADEFISLDDFLKIINKGIKDKIIGRIDLL